MCLGEWRQYLKVVTVVGNKSEGGGTHEYGNWEVVGGGQEKVLKHLLKWETRSRKEEKVLGYCCES